MKLKKSNFNLNKYDEERCYWCGKMIGYGNEAYSSLVTDTSKTMRNFCSENHLELFKKHAKKDTIKRAGMYKLLPYYGLKKNIK